MLSHHFDLTNGTILSLARSLFDFRQTISKNIPLQNILSSSDLNLSEISAPPPTTTALRLAQLFDGGRLTEDTPPRHWHYTFDLLLLDAFGKPPSAHETTLDVDRLHITTCLEIMSNELHFNMCKLPSSFLRTKDMPDLKALASSNISSHLRYACQNWMRRVPQLAILDPKLLQMLREFFRTHFLPWLEVMSLLGLSLVDTVTKIDPERVCDSPTLATMTF